MKAFLGMGLLGSNFVKAMLKKGDEVQVWNRTSSKAMAMEQHGAKAFENLMDAVAGADFIHITLKDDASVDEVLANASSGFKQGAIIIDHTTTSVQGAVNRIKEWKQKGFTYMHAPVFMGPSNALDSSGLMLVSGDQSVIKHLETQLSAMTGKLLNLGNEDGKAAGIKLVGNSFIITLTAGLADALAVAKAHGIKPEEIQDLFEAWNVGSMVQARLKRITEVKYDDPSWELNMARKDAGLMIAATKETNIPLNVLPAVAEAMDQWIAKGHGSEDWTIIGKDSY